VGVDIEGCRDVECADGGMQRREVCVWRDVEVWGVQMEGCRGVGYADGGI